MTSSCQDDTIRGRGALAAHLQACEACQATAPPIDRLVTLLDASVVEINAAALSQRLLLRAQPELQRRAAWVFGRQVAAAVMVALLPLPAVLAYDAYLLGLIYDVVSWLLSARIASFFVGSYAAFLTLLFALTYATVPVLLARKVLPQEPAHGV
jgi:hypothetical protein